MWGRNEGLPGSYGGFRTAAFLSNSWRASDAIAWPAPPAGEASGVGEGQSLCFPVPHVTLLQVFFSPSLLFKFSKCYKYQEQSKVPDQWSLLQDQGSANFSRKEFHSRNLGALWAKPPSTLPSHLKISSSQYHLHIIFT